MPTSCLRTTGKHHWHSGEVRVFVMSGALRVSYGDQLDSAGARTYPAGAFLYVPAGKAHTMGADVNTIIIGIATAAPTAHDAPRGAAAWHARSVAENAHQDAPVVAASGVGRTARSSADPPASRVQPHASCSFVDAGDGPGVPLDRAVWP